jgi:hypothetical protein
MDRDTLRTNYRALVRALYEPKNYYDRVKDLLTHLKAPKEKAPLTLGAALLPGLRCFFWLGLVRRYRFHFWRVFLWTCLHRRQSVEYYLRLALVGYDFRRISDALDASPSTAPAGATMAPQRPPQPQPVSAG